LVDLKKVGYHSFCKTVFALEQHPFNADVFLDALQSIFVVQDILPLDARFCQVLDHGVLFFDLSHSVHPANLPGSFPCLPKRTSPPILLHPARMISSRPFTCAG
jgi:hypothetical protein